MTRDFTFKRLKVIKAQSIRPLLELLDDEPRPFELVIHTPIAGTRPVTIKATNEDDAEYFASVLNRLAYDTDKA